jgi:hypothetical protein
MEQDITIRKVSIHPIELLKEAYRLLGEQYWLFVGMTFVGMLIGSAVPLGILLGPMMCGMYLCYIERKNNKTVEFGLLFKGFDFFAESLIATLIMVAVSLVVLVPAFVIFLIVFVGLMAGTQGEPPVAVFGLLVVLYAVVLVLIILVSLPFVFVYPLIVDRGLKAVPAVKASFQGVLANAFGVLGMLLVYSVISLVASCFCYVPAILFLPLSLGAIFLAYRDVFPVDDKAFQ